jgi:hypothetical protein
MAELPNRQRNAGTFQPGNKIHRSRARAKNKELTDCMLEGVRQAEEGFYQANVKHRLEKEGKAAAEINEILESLDDMSGRDALIAFWKRLSQMGTDAAMKVIAERLLPKAKLPATYISATMNDETAARIGAQMVKGELPPDVAQAMISAINGIKELEERQLMIRMTGLQLEAIEKGLLGAEDDEDK